MESMGTFGKTPLFIKYFNKMYRFFDEILIFDIPFVPGNVFKISLINTNF